MTAAMVVRERPIPFSTDMVKAILDARKSQTRRVVKSPRADFATLEGAVPSSWNQRAAEIRTQHSSVTDETIGYLLGTRSEGPQLLCNRVNDVGLHLVDCPYGVVGDRLWVREAVWFWHEEANYPNEDADSAEQWCEYEWAAFAENPRIGRRRDIVSGKVENVTYLDASSPLDSHGSLANMRRRPAHLAPRWTSRITLEITNVRVERVNDISEADALAEGIERSTNYGLRSWPYLGAEHPVKGTPKVFATATRAYADLWDSLNAKRGCGWDVNPWVWVIEFARVAS